MNSYCCGSAAAAHKVERGMNDDKTLFYSSMIGYRRKLLPSTWLVKALFVDVLSYFFAAEWLRYIATTLATLYYTTIYYTTFFFSLYHFVIVFSLSPFSLYFLFAMKKNSPFNGGLRRRSSRCQSVIQITTPIIICNFQWCRYIIF